MYRKKFYQNVALCRASPAGGLFHQMSTRHQYFFLLVNRMFANSIYPHLLLYKQTDKQTMDEILSKGSFVQNISGWRSLPPNVNQASMFFTSIFTGDQRIQKNSSENALLPYKHTVCITLDISSSIT